MKLPYSAKLLLSMCSIEWLELRFDIACLLIHLTNASFIFQSEMLGAVAYIPHLRSFNPARLYRRKDRRNQAAGSRNRASSATRQPRIRLGANLTLFTNINVYRYGFMQNVKRIRNLLLGTLACLAGCAHNRLALPMTATQLTHYSEGAALAAYLSQANASAEVCDQQASIPHIKVVDDETRKALEQGLRKGQIPPPLWNLCMSSLLRDADPPLSQNLMDDVSQDALEALHEKHLETDANEQSRVDSIWQLYFERESNPSPSPKALKNLVSQLQRDVAKNDLGPFGLSHAKALLDALELEQGRWQGNPVDLAFLNGLLETGDEKTLRLCTLRLPDAALRTTARRYVIRLHIQASHFPEVRGAASAVEKAMMQGGTNPVSLRSHPLVRGLFNVTQVPKRKVVVEQNLLNQTARLVGYAVEGSTPTVLPSIPLRGAIQVDVKGISKPITICPPAKDLDVSPCLLPTDVRLDSSFGVLDYSGVLHVTDTMDESAAAVLARSGQNLVIPILVAGQRVAALVWPATFLTPEDLVLGGQMAGQTGPHLDVRADLTNPTRLIYLVSDGGLRPFWAVVERSSADRFRIVSQGARGYAGSNGSDGMSGFDGTNGSDASCPSFSGTSGGYGSAGSDGGDGASGGPGGAGGSITVTVTGDKQARAEALPLLQQVVLSQGGEGGPGGRGGRGGAGGHGGKGGSGTLCWTTDENGIMSASSSLNGGSDGLDGMSGRDGSNGQSGPPGQPGPVTFVGF
jgi:hypothetical protein